MCSFPTQFALPVAAKSTLMLKNSLFDSSNANSASASKASSVSCKQAY